MELHARLKAVSHVLVRILPDTTSRGFLEKSLHKNYVEVHKYGYLVMIKENRNMKINGKNEFFIMSAIAQFLNF